MRQLRHELGPVQSSLALAQAQFAFLQLSRVTPHLGEQAVVLVEASELCAEGRDQQLVFSAEFLCAKLVDQSDPAVVVLERDDRRDEQRVDREALQRQTDRRWFAARIRETKGFALSKRGEDRAVTQHRVTDAR